MAKKEIKKDFKEEITNIINNVQDDTNKYNRKDIENGRAMAILSYISVLVLIPFLVEKENSYVKFHAKEGLNLFIFEIIGGALCALIDAAIWWIPFLGVFIGTLIGVTVGTFFLALSIIGIVNVCNDTAKELPFIDKFKLVK